MKCSVCNNANINNFDVVPKRKGEQRDGLLVACFECGHWILQIGKYDMAAFPVNRINPSVALDVAEITDRIWNNGEAAGYPISGDNIARVRAGVR